MTEQPLAVVTFSGGMDSTTLAAHYAITHRLLLLSVDYGQRHVRELRQAKLIAEHYDAEHIVADLTGVGELLGGSALTDDIDVPEGHYAWDNMTTTVVPNRNAILANIAVGVAVARKAQVVALGVHAGDHAVYPDCRPEFVVALHELVAKATEGLHTPEVQAPFVHLTKSDIARYGATQLGVPYALTWSCYKGGDLHCGRCGTCVERAEAFAEAGVPDPTEYEDPDSWRKVTSATANLPF